MSNDNCSFPHENSPTKTPSKMLQTYHCKYELLVKSKPHHKNTSDIIVPVFEYHGFPRSAVAAF